MPAVIYIPARDGIINWNGELTYTNTIRIVNNALRLSRGNDARAGDRFARYIPFDSSDGEMYTIFRTLPTAEDGVMGALAMRWREPSRRGGEPSGYTLSVIPDTSAPSGHSLWLENGKRKLASYPIQHYQHGNSYCARFSVLGDTIRAKLWPSADQEPGWQISITDSSVPVGPDRISNGIFTYAKGSVDYDLITFTPGDETAPSASDISYRSKQSDPIDNKGIAVGVFGGFPAGGAYINRRISPRYSIKGNRAFEHLTISRPKLTHTPPRYSLQPNKATGRLTITPPTLLGNGPKYNFRGSRGWVHLITKTRPTLTYAPPVPGELHPNRPTTRLIVSQPTLVTRGPVYALNGNKITARVSVSSPALTALTAAYMQPEGVSLRVDISSPSVIFIPKPEVLELRPSPILARLTITRTNDLLDPSVYNIEYKQYKPDYVGIKAYEGETLNIDRYRPDTIETGKIDSIGLKTNRYKQIVIK